MNYFNPSDRRLHRVVTLFNDNEWDFLIRYQRLMNYPSLSRAIRAAVWNQLLHHTPNPPHPKHAHTFRTTSEQPPNKPASPSLHPRSRNS